jgi:hypothetical protein
VTEVPAEGGPPPKRPLHPLLKRLPLLLVAAIGLVYVLPQAPRDVEVDYDFGSHGLAATHVDIELRDGRGVGLRRTELNLVPGTRRHTQRVRLARGRYHATLTFSSPSGTERVEQDLAVADEEVVEVRLNGG